MTANVVLGSDFDVEHIVQQRTAEQINNSSTTNKPMFRRLAPDTKTIASSLRLIRPRASPQSQPASAMLDQRGIEGIIHSRGHTGGKGIRCEAGLVDLMSPIKDIIQLPTATGQSHWENQEGNQEAFSSIIISMLTFIGSISMMCIQLADCQPTGDLNGHHGFG